MCHHIVSIYLCTKVLRWQKQKGLNQAKFRSSRRSSMLEKIRILNIVVCFLFIPFDFDQQFARSHHQHSTDPEISHNLKWRRHRFIVQMIFEAKKMQTQWTSSFICSTLIDKAHRCFYRWNCPLRSNHSYSNRKKTFNCHSIEKLIETNCSFDWTLAHSLTRKWNSFELLELKTIIHLCVLVHCWAAQSDVINYVLKWDERAC